MKDFIFGEKGRLFTFENLKNMLSQYFQDYAYSIV